MSVINSVFSPKMESNGMRVKDKNISHMSGNIMILNFG